MQRKKLVVLTGAGISAESGIATFRDSNGLWEQHRIEDVATPEAWNSNPALVLAFYNKRRQQASLAQPNEAHKILASFQDYFETFIITQNVDNLHERAGSKHVLHLHGSLFSKCSDKNINIKKDCFEDIILYDKAPDGGYWRPDIVWFGEAVPNMDLAIPIVQAADIFLIIGTSLQVYPAASLSSFCNSKAECFYIDPNKANNIPNKFRHINKNASEGLNDIMEFIL